MLATLDIRAAGHFLDAAVGPSILEAAARPIRAQSRHPQLMTLDSVAASRDQKHLTISVCRFIAITDLRYLYALLIQASVAYYSSILSLYWLSRIIQLPLYFFLLVFASPGLQCCNPRTLLSQRHLDKPQFFCRCWNGLRHTKQFC